MDGPLSVVFVLVSRSNASGVRRVGLGTLRTLIPLKCEVRHILGLESM